jgi:excisionase family DNA binding protein
MANNTSNSHGIDDSSDVYIDDRALAQLLGCSRVTLQQARTRGEGIPYVKIGRLVRYSTRTVREWLAANTRGRLPAVPSTSQVVGALRPLDAARSTS